MSLAGTILTVQDIGTNIAFNPFPLGNGIIACRIEDPESDWLNKVHQRTGPYNPHSKFFKENNTELIPLDNAPTFTNLEDPFGTWITDPQGNRQILFGGVEVDFQAQPNPQIMTKLFLAPSIQDLQPDKPIAIKRGMRDIRFCQPNSKELVMLTRPTTGEAYPGSIAFAILTLTELLDPHSFQEKFNTAHLLKFAIPQNVRLGANSVYPYNGMLRVICHTSIADPYTNEKDELITNDFINGKIHYEAYEFSFDPTTYSDEPIQLNLLARSSDFPQNPAYFKSDRYTDVVFPGGMMNGNLYVGLGDRSTARIQL